MSERRVPPHNIEAEQSVLGAMILNKDAIIAVTEFINGEDFYRESHKRIYQAIINLYRDNAPVDLVTLSDELLNENILEKIGGTEYLSELTDKGLIATNAKYYAKIIEEKAILRRLIQISSDILEKGYDTEDTNSLIDMAEKSIFEVSQHKNQEGLDKIDNVLDSAFEQIEYASKTQGRVTGVPTGFADLDEKTSGLQRSDLILVAARPSMGKTALAINICQNAAVRSGKTVAIFSLEMSKEQLVQRMLSTEALIPISDIRDGNLEAEDWVNLTRAMSPLSKANIYIDDTPGITPMELRAKCRKLKMEKGLDMIMIDYLQLMNGDSKAESRRVEIGFISRTLKGIAREMDCPVIALSQLSRAPDARPNHRPILSDLRESGSIEQDADIVMFLYRDEYYQNEGDEEDRVKGVAEVIIAKQRNGETGTIKLAWLGQYTKFANLAQQ